MSIDTDGLLLTLNNLVALNLRYLPQGYAKWPPSVTNTSDNVKYSVLASSSLVRGNSSSFSDFLRLHRTRATKHIAKEMERFSGFPCL